MDVYELAQHQTAGHEFSLCLTSRISDQIGHCDLLWIDSIDGQRNTATALDLCTRYRVLSVHRSPLHSLDKDRVSNIYPH